MTFSKSDKSITMLVKIIDADFTTLQHQQITPINVGESIQSIFRTTNIPTSVIQPRRFRSPLSTSPRIFRPRSFNKVHRLKPPEFTHFINKNDFSNILANNICSTRTMPVWFSQAFSQTVSFLSGPLMTSFLNLFNLSSVFVNLSQFFNKFLTKFWGSSTTQIPLSGLELDLQAKDIFATYVKDAILTFQVRSPNAIGPDGGSFLPDVHLGDCIVGNILRGGPLSESDLFVLVKEDVDLSMLDIYEANAVYGCFEITYSYSKKSPTKSEGNSGFSNLGEAVRSPIKRSSRTLGNSTSRRKLFTKYWGTLSTENPSEKKYINFVKT